VENFNADVVVRKYGNRRLYRTDESRYVTLDELATLVRDDVNFQVLDAKTGSDLTGVVLAQVILEEEKRSDGEAFPTELLRQLIRLRDPALADFVTHHLPRLTEIYLETRAATADSLDLVAAGEAEGGEAVIITQLAAVKEQLTQILEALEVEDISQD
jgi:polyhydroxyalkanoate synthesis repressor PhaR